MAWFFLRINSNINQTCKQQKNIIITQFTCKFSSNGHNNNNNSNNTRIARNRIGINEDFILISKHFLILNEYIFIKRMTKTMFSRVAYLFISIFLSHILVIIILNSVQILKKKFLWLIIREKLSPYRTLETLTFVLGPCFWSNTRFSYYIWLRPQRWRKVKVLLGTSKKKY